MRIAYDSLSVGFLDDKDRFFEKDMVSYESISESVDDFVTNLFFPENVDAKIQETIKNIPNINNVHMIISDIIYDVSENIRGNIVESLESIKVKIGSMSQQSDPDLIRLGFNPVISDEPTFRKQIVSSMFRTCTKEELKTVIINDFLKVKSTNELDNKYIDLNKVANELNNTVLPDRLKAKVESNNTMVRIKSYKLEPNDNDAIDIIIEIENSSIINDCFKFIESLIDLGLKQNSLEFVHNNDYNRSIEAKEAIKQSKVSTNFSGAMPLSALNTLIGEQLPGLLSGTVEFFRGISIEKRNNILKKMDSYLDPLKVIIKECYINSADVYEDLRDYYKERKDLANVHITFGALKKKTLNITKETLIPISSIEDFIKCFLDEAYNQYKSKKKRPVTFYYNFDATLDIPKKEAKKVLIEQVADILKAVKPKFKNVDKKSFKYAIIDKKNDMTHFDITLGVDYVDYDFVKMFGELKELCFEDRKNKGLEAIHQIDQSQELLDVILSTTIPLAVYVFLYTFLLSTSIKTATNKVTDSRTNRLVLLTKLKNDKKLVSDAKVITDEVLNKIELARKIVSGIKDKDVTSKLRSKDSDIKCRVLKGRDSSETNMDNIDIVKLAFTNKDKDKIKQASSPIMYDIVQGIAKNKEFIIKDVIDICIGDETIEEELGSSEFASKYGTLSKDILDILNSLIPSNSNKNFSFGNIQTYNKGGCFHYKAGIVIRIEAGLGDIKEKCDDIGKLIDK